MEDTGSGRGQVPLQYQSTKSPIQRPPRNSDSRIPSQNPPLTGHFWGLDLKGKKGPLNRMIRWSFVTPRYNPHVPASRVDAGAAPG